MKKVCNNVNEEAAKKAEFYSKGTAMRVFVSILLSVVLFEIPLIYYLYYYDNGLKENIVEGLAISSGLVFIILSVLIYSIMKKSKMKKVFMKIKTNLEKENDKIKSNNKKISESIALIDKKISIIERHMSDRKNCCIHQHYWNVGPYLFQLIDTGRANTLSEAINIYENEMQHEMDNLMQESYMLDLDRKISEIKNIEEERLTEMRKNQQWNDLATASILYELSSL